MLAIAGLIFLMVFVAFPALQRNQRDAQRQQDYANLQAAVITAASNNGSFPTSISTNSMNKDGKDPNKVDYNIVMVSGAESTVPGSFGNNETNKVYVIEKALCTADGVPTRSNASSNDFVIFGYLENGTYCRSASTQ